MLTKMYKTEKESRNERHIKDLYDIETVKGYNV